MHCSKPPLSCKINSQNRHRTISLYIDIQCQILMQQYCAVLVFINKNEREKHCTMVTAIVPHLDLDKWYIAIHSAKQYYSSGGNSRFIKHITGSGRTDESPKRGFFNRKNVGAFTMY